MPAKKKLWCYFIPPTMENESGFIPAIVLAGVEGYRLLPRIQEKGGAYFWRDNYEEALQVCREANQRTGISEQLEDAIIASAIAPTLQNIKRAYDMAKEEGV